MKSLLNLFLFAIRIQIGMGFKLDLADLAMKSLLKFSMKSLLNLSLCDQLMGLMGFNGIKSISKFCLLAADVVERDSFKKHSKMKQLN